MDGISTSNSAIEMATAWLGEFGAALARGLGLRAGLDTGLGTF
jgi:hypothetical protein